ncbi:Gfo/Idh/MocA family protein [Noviherbaspirillum galbum]|uniref:Gfo/Idh/MocA family oxidoreductase n=1 Tax=Noviherbaspirillum galbum TaxID=2709383 RepID=A0A6B3SGA8_9BURK|nr:Gfo/Idh/MocA family oxidoreductase [Noviherbaspirillum galbum]NEX59660.1 Gfo/Idh/MocA family oxidoreductase [Noviherbaspirillum galbum]
METRNQPVRVAIFGCGLIGSEWDHDSDGGHPARTHAAAFSRNAGSRIVAMCDRDAARAERAAVRWNCRAFTEPERLFAAVGVDLVVVAASSDARWSVIEPALAAGVRLFIIEKPLATSLEESQRIATALEAAGARAIVNYSRRWDVAMRDLRDAIRHGELGRIQRFVGYYGKGLVNSGSHMLDLAGFLCGGRPLRARALGSPLPSGESAWSPTGDRAFDAQVVFGNDGDDGKEIELSLLGTDCSAFTCFELRIIGTKAIVEMSQGGRRLLRTPVTEDPNFPGYRIPGDAQPIASGLLDAMQLMADEAVMLANGALDHPACDAQTALRTAMAVEAVKQSDRQGGQWMSIGE